MSLSGPAHDAQSELLEGGYYSIIDGDAFCIAKILKLDPEIVHVRIYKQHFSERPIYIDTDELTLGTIYDKDGFGMGHLPLRILTFMQSEPSFLTWVAVQPSELEGYNMWKEGFEGGAFA